MAIPGSSLNILVDVAAIAGSTEAYKSLATFLRRSSVVDSAGQDVHSFNPIDSAHTDVPCRKSPLIQIRPQDQIQVRAEAEFDIAKFQVNTVVSLPDIKVNDQITITDPTGHSGLYQIMSVEVDGNGLASRFMIGQELPFNA